MRSEGYSDSISSLCIRNQYLSETELNHYVAFFDYGSNFYGQLQLGEGCCAGILYDSRDVVKLPNINPIYSTAKK